MPNSPSFELASDPVLNRTQPFAQHVSSRTGRLPNYEYLAIERPQEGRSLPNINTCKR